mmetsp:Transcript_20686/g.55387  ORF Transcript_20686/g.55387 Transcript_20686/m.55387 type:complete len:249 (-) Transcript_20686:35-781(-)
MMQRPPCGRNPEAEGVALDHAHEVNGICVARPGGAQNPWRAPPPKNTTHARAAPNLENARGICKADSPRPQHTARSLGDGVLVQRWPQPDSGDCRARQPPARGTTRCRSARLRNWHGALRRARGPTHPLRAVDQGGGDAPGRKLSSSRLATRRVLVAVILEHLLNRERQRGARRVARRAARAEAAAAVQRHPAARARDERGRVTTEPALGLEGRGALQQHVSRGLGVRPPRLEPTRVLLGLAQLGMAS